MRDASTERLARERDLYLRILQLAGSPAVEPLLRDVLELLVEISGALQAYVEISDPVAEDDAIWSVAHDCTTDELEAIRMRISRGVIAASLAAGRTLETTSARVDERFRERASVKLGPVEAVLCTPIGSTPPFGVVYLHGHRRERAFPHAVREQVELLASHLAPIAERLVARSREERERDATRALRTALRATAIVGRSEAVATLLRQILLFAPLDAPVLVAGSPGSGRRLAARVLHENGVRAAGPLIEIDAAGLSGEACAERLFGRSRPGALHEARGGSVLIRHLDAVALAIQAPLLGFVETGRWHDLEGRLQESDARLLATAPEGRGRAARAPRDDLRLRLETLTLRVPGVAERTSDIPVLARAFCERSAARRHAPRVEFSPPALRALESLEWPGEVAELERAVDDAVERVVREGLRQIETRHLAKSTPASLAADGSTEPVTFQVATREFQKALLARVLQETQWNISATARRLELARSHVYNLIHTFELTRGVNDS